MISGSEWIRIKNTTIWVVLPRGGCPAKTPRAMWWLYETAP